MKKIILSIIIVLTTMQSFAQVPKKPIDNTPAKSTNAVAYRLFPTQNIWTFIKLNTKNGLMWQVQYDVEGSNRIVSNLSLEPLVSIEKEANDRFTLYPTQNLYTFILLDQIDGRTWQVQWSMESKERGILLIE